MGLMVDTNVLIHFEKSGKANDLMGLNKAERAFISTVTAAELLAGVGRANTEERRKRRSNFVEAIITAYGVLDFTLDSARIHAEIHTHLASKGQMIGAHDLLIAATARQYGMAILTENVGEFARVPGLIVIPFKTEFD